MKKLYVFIFIFLLIISLSSVVFAADPKIVTNINKALTSIKDWIIKISTPAAAVAIGSGVLIKKFSFGDEERMQTGRKIIRNSIFSYGLIIGVDLVLKAITSLINPSK